jgi:hypothetical protein
MDGVNLNISTSKIKAAEFKEENHVRCKIWTKNKIIR